MCLNNEKGYPFTWIEKWKLLKCLGHMYEERSVKQQTRKPPFGN